MDMSDTDESDNEMFANKAEYDSFKQHFKTKAVKAVTSGGGGGGEYGGDADTSEYLDATREERAAAERLTEVRERLDALRATPSDAPFATEAEAQQLAELLASVRAAAEERAKEQQQAAK